MKAYLALISAAVIGLSACSQEPAAPAAEQAPAASPEAPATENAPQEASAASAVPAAAAGNCAVTVESNDAMQFDTKDIRISKACAEFSITLKHVGTQPKASMGHNLVITKAEDQDGVFKDGVAAGPDADYLKPNDTRVIAHTKLIGGGEEDTIKIDTAKLADGNYKFVCTFPGHGALMNGTVTLVD